MPPQTSVIARVRGTHIITAINTGFMRKEPGLMVGDTLAQVEPRRGCPVLILNETSKAFELKKGNVLFSSRAS